MVRLKLKLLLLNKQEQFTSQFHYGSIKTVYGMKRYSWFYKSQFHYGSIKTKLKETLKKHKIQSQFHYGSIKTDYSIKREYIWKEVSIPLWFD